MAFIGPNIFYFRTIFTSSSARLWASPRESFHPLSLDFTCVVCTQLPPVIISTSLAVHFHFILALIHTIPLAVATLSDPLPLVMMHVMHARAV
jgi:hypothetical protein